MTLPATKDGAVIAEFKEFINRGNMIDLAVGFVMGVAFQAVVSSLTDRVLTPLIAWVFGEPDFDQLLTFGPVGEDGVQIGSVGAVLTALINFLLVALALFLVVKGYNRMQRAEPSEPEPEADPEDVVLLREIRDTLRAGANAAVPEVPGAATEGPRVTPEP